MGITDSRIRYLTSYIYTDFLVDNVEVDGQAFNDIQECLLELPKLRQKISDWEKAVSKREAYITELEMQNAELIANSKRLANGLNDMLAEVELDRQISMPIEHEFLDQHNELMERYNG